MLQRLTARRPHALALTSVEPVVLVVLVGLAFITRFHAIGMDSLWLDEVISFHRARSSFSRLVAESHSHHHNPAYFLLLRAWMGIGDDEVMLRAPSALFGALTIPVAYLIGRVVGGPWVAVATALATLLNPRLVAYAQEARMYSIYAFGGSVAMAGLLWLIENPAASVHPLWALLRRAPRHVGARAGLAWLACSFGWVITLYCHATAALFVLSCSLVAALRVAVQPLERRRFFVSWCIANVLALLAYGPWLFRVVRQVGSFHGAFWAVFPTGQRAAWELGVAFGYGDQGLRWVLAAVLALAGTVALRSKPLVAASLWLLALSGPGLVLMVSFWQPMFLHRLFLWATLPFGVILGSGLVVLRPPAARLAVLLPAVFAAAAALRAEYYETYTKERWREAIEFVASRAERGDRVALGSHSVKLVLEYYFLRKTRPFARFPYDSAKTIPSLVTDDARGPLWVLARGRHPGTFDEDLTRLGWENAGVKRFGNGVEVARYRTRARPRRSPRVNAM